MSGARWSLRRERNAHGLESIKRSLVQIRVLHYTSDRPVSAAAILQQLRQRGCAMTVRSLSALLGRMTRDRWIEVTGGGAGGAPLRREWLSTAKGRRVLEVAKEQLEQVTAKWRTTQKLKQENRYESTYIHAHNQFQCQCHDLPG